MNLNSPPSSHFPIHDNDPFRSSSVSCHFFFNPTQDHHHTAGFYDHVPDDQNYGYGGHGGSSTYEIKNKVDSGLSFTLWKKEDDDIDHEHMNHDNSNPMKKWMSSSKMRVMQKMKTADNHDRVAVSVAVKTTSNNADQKLQPSSSSAETDFSSNSSSYNNSPIRVCSDCNTTKTPLWRSGPKGPKSLCNACGIRQRKARRAMAAAAANGASTNDASDRPVTMTTTMKIKLQHKGKSTGKNGHASQLKKRCKTAVAGASNEEKQLNNFEDYLINLSKNLSFHRVFPDDEKDAAILLMALSSGLVNG